MFINMRQLRDFVSCARKGTRKAAHENRWPTKTHNATVHLIFIAYNIDKCFWFTIWSVWAVLELRYRCMLWHLSVPDHCHCGETVTIIAVTIIQDGGIGDGEFGPGPILTLVRNTVLSYLHTIQGRHQSWFWVSCFVSLCICFWNMGLWNFRDMILTYQPDIGDMIVTVQEVWS